MYPASKNSEAFYEDVRDRTRSGLGEFLRRMSELITREDELEAMLDQGVNAADWTDEERERWWREHPRPERGGTRDD